MQGADTSRKRLWVFSSAESVVLIVLSVCLVSAVAVKVVQRTHPAGTGMEVSTSRSDFSYKIDLNAASRQELTLVPGIGVARARKIVEYRGKHGRFTVIDDLAKIDGFSAKLVGQLREYLTVEPEDQGTPK